MKTHWLTEELKQEIKELYEPRYKKTLTDTEVLEIANNLTDLLEIFFKFKWRQQYENK